MRSFLIPKNVCRKSKNIDATSANQIETWRVNIVKRRNAVRIARDGDAPGRVTEHVHRSRFHRTIVQSDLRNRFTRCQARANRVHRHESKRLRSENANVDVDGRGLRTE